MPLLALSLVLLTVLMISTEETLLTVLMTLLPFVRLPPPPAEYVWSSLGTDVIIGVLQQLIFRFLDVDFSQDSKISLLNGLY